MIDVVTTEISVVIGVIGVIRVTMVIVYLSGTPLVSACQHASSPGVRPSGAGGT